MRSAASRWLQKIIADCDFKEQIKWKSESILSLSLEITSLKFNYLFLECIFRKTFYSQSYFVSTRQFLYRALGIVLRGNDPLQIPQKLNLYDQHRQILNQLILLLFSLSNSKKSLVVLANF